jgi:hypothetical protein
VNQGSDFFAGRKNMMNSNIQKAYNELIKLTISEKIMLISKILPELSREVKKDAGLNIYDLKGVGKEIWKGTDAQEYVNKERDSWE